MSHRLAELPSCSLQITFVFLSQLLKQMDTTVHKTWTVYISHGAVDDCTRCHTQCISTRVPFRSGTYGWASTQQDVGFETTFRKLCIEGAVVPPIWGCPLNQDGQLASEALVFILMHLHRGNHKNKIEGIFTAIYVHWGSSTALLCAL